MPEGAGEFLHHKTAVVKLGGQFINAYRVLMLTLVRDVADQFFERASYEKNRMQAARFHGNQSLTGTRHAGDVWRKESVQTTASKLPLTKAFEAMLRILEDVKLRAPR